MDTHPHLAPERQRGMPAQADQRLAPVPRPRQRPGAAGAVAARPGHPPGRTRPRCAMTRWSPAW